MKFLKNAMFAMLASVLFIACSKDKDSTPAPQTLEGRFVGQYKFTNSAPTYYYSLNFKAGGILEEINSSNQKIGEGTWQLNGSTMTASYHYTFGNQTAFSLQQLLMVPRINLPGPGVLTTARRMAGHLKW